MAPRNQNEFSSDSALGPHKTVAPIKTTTSYNVSGLPTPPAGWGKNVGTVPSIAPDTCC